MAAGTSSVTVELSSNGQDFTEDGVLFTYEDAVAMMKVIPASGSVGGGTRVVVHGNGYDRTKRLDCLFGSVAVSAAFVSSTTVMCSSPPVQDPAMVLVSVITHGEQRQHVTGMPFEYLAQASVSTISPPTGLSS